MATGQLIREYREREPVRYHRLHRNRNICRRLQHNDEQSDLREIFAEHQRICIQYIDL
jgi:hypothetical protein